MEATVFQSWGVGIALGWLFLAGYAAWMREVRQKPIGDDVVPLALSVLFCPVAIVIALVGFSAWMVFYFLPGALVHGYVTRRERVARAESAAKLAADEAHYEVERGAHR